MIGRRSTCNVDYRNGLMFTLFRIKYLGVYIKTHIPIPEYMKFNGSVYAARIFLTTIDLTWFIFFRAVHKYSTNDKIEKPAKYNNNKRTV